MSKIPKPSGVSKISSTFTEHERTVWKEERSKQTYIITDASRAVRDITKKFETGMVFILLIYVLICIPNIILSAGVCVQVS